ncbi:MAG: hypothetical protein LDL23_12080 [Flavobacterium sp.]|uniref:hypothetical protein n=1 Tax=Flavobacterium sp. TaxID=239 RepID=UPI0025B8814D|nr:hypothetical protein [Flavobacterium sp.]MCA1967368.1 hypothetical protein [Flavobacterium sp.]
MDNLIIYSLGFLILLPILIGYYFDYKNDPKEFKLSLKSLWNKRSSKALLFLIIYFSFVKIYEHTIPLNKNKGIEFNSTREKIGIPLIGKNWEINDSRYRTIWSNVDSTDRHFRKTIEYGILNAKTETDYYQNKKREGTFAWSVYNYGNNSFEYYLEKPNEKLVSVNEKGNLKYENPTIEKKVNKTEFEKYITE